MKIIENGILFDEQLRHPISAYYLHSIPSEHSFAEIIMRMFGFSF